MPIIKSNQLFQAGTAMVSGDHLLSGPQSQAPSSSDPDPVQTQRTVPVAPPDETDVDAELEILSQRAQAPLAQDAPLDRILEQFDDQKQALIERGQALGEQALEQGMARVEMGLPASLARLEEQARQQLEGSLKDPDGVAQAMEALGPQLEDAARSNAQAQAIQKAAVRRWQEAATTEEQIALLMEAYSRQVADSEEAAQIILNLLADREGVLAQARLLAQQHLLEAQSQAAAIVAEAKQQAAQTRFEVESQRKQILETLEQQGFAQGYQEGRSQADEEAEKIVSEAINTLNVARSTLPDAIRDNQASLLTLAIDIARKIIDDEIATSPQRVNEILERAIKRVSDTERVEIKVHPDDLPLVQGREDHFRELLKNVRNLFFTGTPKVARGGVLIETSSGSVDATLQTQLSVILEAFKKTLGEFGHDAAADPPESLP